MHFAVGSLLLQLLDFCLVRRNSLLKRLEYLHGRRGGLLEVLQDVVHLSFTFLNDRDERVPKQRVDEALHGALWYCLLVRGRTKRHLSGAFLQFLQTCFLRIHVVLHFLRVAVHVLRELLFLLEFLHDLPLLVVKCY